MNKKKFKNLLNSVSSNGGAMEGALQKIREMFLEELQEEVEKLKPDFSESKLKINKIVDYLAEYMAIQEDKAEKIRKSMEKLNLGNMDEKLQNVKEFLGKTDTKTGELGEVYNNLRKILDEGQGFLEDALKNVKNDIDKNLSDLLSEIGNKKEEVIDSIREEIEERKTNLNEMVEVWKKSIKDRTETFEKEFELYIEKKGIELIIKYVRNNALKLLWTLFMGLFSKYKEKKSK